MSSKSIKHFYRQCNFYCFVCGTYFNYTVVAKSIRALVFSPARNDFKSVISIFCCSVSIGNISLHFQTLILPIIVIIQWDFCLTTSSAPHRDLIWSSSVCLESHEETEQTETKSRRTVATSPRCFRRSICTTTWKTLLKCTEGKNCF